jgi:hypothetical protein
MPSRFKHCLLPCLLVIAAALTVGCPADDPVAQPPIVTLDVRTEETYRVGQDIIQIHVTATDPQGGPLTFRMPDQPARSQFQTFQNSAVFTWDPIASDVTGDTPRRLIFAATNSRGLTTERVVNVRILAGNGQPRFLNSTSELYDPESNAPLVIDVRVRDDDSNQVTLTMPRALAPEGASFEVTGSHDARFSWMPSPVQVTRRVHTVTFVADDGDNPPVEHKVTIIIKQKDGGSTPGPGAGAEVCEAEAVLAHAPLGAQRTAAAYPLSVTLQGAGGSRYTDVYAYWTLDDPFNGNNQQWNGVELVRDGSTFRGSIPNLMLSAGSTRDVFYQICAYDMEATEDDDSAILCAPTSIAYGFVAYAPDYQGCIDDQPRINTPAQASRISRDAYTHHRLCSGETDYHVIDIEPGEEVLLVALYPFGRQASIKLLDENLNELPDLFVSPCSGYALVDIENTGGAPRRYYLQATGHDVPYHITAFSSGDGDLSCPGGNLEPNNTPSQATIITDEYTFFENIGICSADDMDIYAIELVRGDLFSADLYFDHVDGDLDMVLYAPSQQAQVTQQGFGVAQGLSATDDESIIYTAQESGFYFLNVFTANTPNIYSLEIETLCVDADRFAGNHTRQTAAVAGIDESYDNLKLCPDKSDWYRQQGFAGRLLLAEARALYGGRPSDLTLELYNEAGTLLARGEALGDTNDLDYQITQNNMALFIKVSSNRPMLYRLTILQF